MNKTLSEIEETPGLAMRLAERAGIEKFLLTEEFSASPASSEILPDGLISDEV